MSVVKRTLRFLGLAWIGWRLLGPELPSRFAPGQTRPSRIPGRTVFVDDREFFVRETGPEDGPALLLLHGWSFDGEMTFFRLIPLLAERFRVIVPDNRGHGRSDWMRERYEIADVADDAAGILQQLGVERAYVFGYSMGGMIAQELAHRHPDRVHGLALAATAARPVWSDAAFRLALLLGRTIARVSRKEFSTISTRVLVRSGAVAPEHARWMWEGLMRRDANLYFQAGDAVRRFDSRPWIGSLRTPAMVIVNSDDQLMPPAMQYGLATYFGEDAVAVIDGGRHESVMNRADEHAKLITEFVDSLAVE